MGNYNSAGQKDALYMHIKIVGSNMKKFYDIYCKSKELENITKFWDVDPISSLDIKEELDEYFESLDEKDEADNIRESLILKVTDFESPEYIFMLEKMNSLLETYRMPLVLLLTTKKIIEKTDIVPEKYHNIDERLIFVRDFEESLNNFEEIITPVLLRFCSIHNELGDRFNLGTKIDQDFDLIKNAFPFNLNIACIGRFGQGKSTGVNKLLKEYKAKESTKGASQTKNLTFYQVENKPIRILDIPGFEDEKTVKDAVEKLKLCGEASNKIRDNIHIILYFLNYSEKRAFSEMEYPILEQIANHQESQIIYVITHSRSGISLESKKKVYNRINSGIQGKCKNKPIKDKLGMFKANENNVVFVNFHKSEDEEPFGTKELFRKIHDFFVESETYKNSLKSLNKEELEKQIDELKAKAKYTLLPNKFLGALFGAIPFVDLFAQKFIINKNAIKKVGQLFGIQANFIDEENEKEEKKKEEDKNLIKPDYIKDNIEQENLDLKINGDKFKEELTQDTEDSKLAKLGKIGVSGVQIQKIGTGTNIILQNMDIMNKAEQLFSEADLIEKLYSMDHGISVVDDLQSIPVFASKYMDNKWLSLVEKAENLQKSASGVNILNFFGIGTIFGVACGGFFTHKFCEALIDKFVVYYRKNAHKIENSYENALSYFK